MRTLPPTETQAEYLRNNYKLYQNAQLAQHLGVKEWRISEWLKMLGISKLAARKSIAEKKADKKRVILPPPLTKRFTRQPARYDNVSREEHIEKWLNVKI